MTAPAFSTAIYVSGLNVRFAGFAAITNLSMELRYGEIRAIIGPNGAGKTTLMDVITGKTRPASGEVFLDKITNLATLDETSIARLGIGRKFQKPSIFEALLVRENLELAIRNGHGYADMIRSRLKTEQNRRIDEVLETIGLLPKSGGLPARFRMAEAVARDRHAAGRGSACDLARRTGRGHDRSRDRTHGRTDRPLKVPGARGRGDRARHGLCRRDRGPRERAA